MSSKTKIVVLKLKEMIYTIIFVVLGIILLLLLILIITKKTSKENVNIPQSTFIPGAYTSSIVLSTNPVDIEVIVDHNQIKSIQLINTSESVETMYPLISSSLSSIESQVIKNNSIENITYDTNAKYTSLVLIDAISQALEKAYNN